MMQNDSTLANNVAETLPTLHLRHQSDDLIAIALEELSAMTGKTLMRDDVTIEPEGDVFVMTLRADVGD